MFPKNVLKLRPLTELWYKSFQSSSSWWGSAPPICQAYSFLKSMMLESIAFEVNKLGIWKPGRPSKNQNINKKICQPFTWTFIKTNPVPLYMENGTNY